MSEDEIRLRLLELMWRHPSPAARTTAEILASIEGAFLPWVTGTRTARDIWPDLIPPKDTPTP